MSEGLKRPIVIVAACALLDKKGAVLIANLLLFQQWEKSLDPRYLALPLIACAFFFAGALGLATGCSTGVAPEQAPGLATKHATGLAPQGPMNRVQTALQIAVLAFAAVLLALETLAFAERFERDYAQTSDPVMTLFREVREVLPEGAVVAQR